jgi:pimeloyl-ACP methyl ester carboxylesterase
MSRIFTTKGCVGCLKRVFMAAVAIHVGCGTGAEPIPPPGPPAGAVAGDFETTPCVHTAGDVDYVAECGALIVPENRSDPDTRLIALPVTRIPASGEASAEPIFWLGGGPGSSNLGYRRVEWFHEDHDIVLVGYRGIDGSVYLGCPEIGEALVSGPPMMSRECMKMQGEAAAACADRLTAEGIDLDGYTVLEVVDDIEAARSLVRDEQ